MHVVVIGSGVIGSSVAYETAKAGAKVTLFDAGKLGGDASSVSFAWTNATSKNPKSYFSLNVGGMRAHLELGRDFGGAPWLSQTGSFEWRTTEEGRQWQVENFERMRDWGYGIRWISPAQLSALEPDIDVDAIGSNPIVYYPEEGWVDPLIYSAWLLRVAASRFGAVLRPNTPIAAIETQNGRAVAVRTAAGERVAADVVINCTGSRADEDLGVPALPMASTIGVLGFTLPVATTLRGQFHVDDLDVRPDGAGRLMLHKVSVDNRLSTAGRVAPNGPEALELLDATRRYLPALRGVDIEAIRTTVRPVTRDGYTCVGAMPQMINYYVAVTHSGVTLAPLIGKALADEIVLGNILADLDPFRPERLFGEQTVGSAYEGLVGQSAVAY